MTPALTAHEFHALRGELLGDDPMRLVFRDGTEVHGIAATCGSEKVMLLTAAGTWKRVRYAEIVAAVPLSPGADYDAVVDAMERAGLFVD